MATINTATTRIAGTELYDSEIQKNETIYCEGETPENLNVPAERKGKDLQKDGVGDAANYRVMGQRILCLSCLFCRRKFRDRCCCLWAMYHVPDSHARQAADYWKIRNLPCFHQTVVERLGSPTKEQPTWKTHSGTFGRIIAFPEDTYGVEEDQCTLRHLSLQRIQANLSQHDHIQCHVEPCPNFRPPKNWLYWRTKNQSSLTKKN